jgi:hypothetical protein
MVSALLENHELLLSTLETAQASRVYDGKVIQLRGDFVKPEADDSQSFHVICQYEN